MKPFELPTQHIRARLTRPPARGEFIALVIVAVLAVGFGVLEATGTPIAHDYELFYNTAERDYTYGFYYGPWILPLFSLLALLPLSVSFIVWNLLNIVMLWGALRVFGGNIPVALLSYQSFYCLFYGQIVGLIAGALALLWWSLQARRVWLAGLMFALAAAKPQLGLPIGVTLILLADISWFNRIKVVFVSSLPVLASVIWYPDFITDVYYGAIYELSSLGSISLWRYVGAWSLLVWLPVLFVPLTPGRRLVAVLAATALSLPYFQQTDLLVLYALPVGWVGLLGNLGYLMAFIGWGALPLMVIVPLVTYGWVFVSHVRGQTQSRTPITA